MKYRTLKKRIESIDTQKDARDIINIIDQQLNRLESQKQKNRKSLSSKQIRKINMYIKKYQLLKKQVQRSFSIRDRSQPFKNKMFSEQSLKFIVVESHKPRSLPSNLGQLLLKQKFMLAIIIATTLLFCLMVAQRSAQINYQDFIDEYLQPSTHALRPNEPIHIEEFTVDIRDLNGDENSINSADNPNCLDESQNESQPEGVIQYWSTISTQVSQSEGESDDEVQSNIDPSDVLLWISSINQEKNPIRTQALTKKEIERIQN